jgi:hypothetical protein
VSGGTPPEVPPSLMVGTCYYGMDDGALSARTIGGGTGSELPPDDGQQDAPNDVAGGPLDSSPRSVAQALREDWARSRVAESGHSWATHMVKFDGTVVPRGHPACG